MLVFRFHSPVFVIWGYGLAILCKMLALKSSSLSTFILFSVFELPGLAGFPMFETHTGAQLPNPTRAPAASEMLHRKRLQQHPSTVGLVLGTPKLQQSGECSLWR